MPAESIITSVNNPRVKALVKLRDHRGRRKADRFIAEGRRAVERAIDAELHIDSIWTCDELLGSDQGSPIQADRLATLPCEQVQTTPAVFRKLAYVRDPEGILAVCQPPAWSIDALPDAGPDTLDLVAVGTEKPGNLGAMVRTADLAGCRSVLAVGTPVDAMNPNAIRASTASVFTLPTVSLDPQDAIDYLVRHRIRLIAAVVDGQVQHTQADYTGPCAIAIGPEDRGLADAWHQAAEQTHGQTVRIPTLGRTADSLNASVAAGVLLFEARRQRPTSRLQ